MFTVTITNTITNAAPVVAEFGTRSQCLDLVRETMDAGTNYVIKENPEPCHDCGEPKENNWYAFCKACQFSNNDAVKAARKIIRAARRAGNPVVAVNDGGDIVKGKERELLEAVHSVDTSRLIFESGSQVLIVSGNESEADCIADYNMSLDAIIEDAKLRQD